MTDLSEYEKMLAGEFYLGAHPQLIQKREAARLACARYQSHPSKGNLKHITRLFHNFEGGHIEPGFQCDYGLHIRTGKQFFANFNCILLDSAEIFIGDHVMLGPDVHVYTVDHPRDPVERAKGLCMARPVRIGSNVWVGGGCRILPGVEIGDGVIIPANTVVKESLPEGFRF